MVRRLVVGLVVLLAAAVLVPFGPTPGGAGEVGGTTEVFVVHGLNLAGQDSPDDGGVPVTVCIDGEVVIDVLEFGDVVPLTVTNGTDVLVQVADDAPQPTCEGTTFASDVTFDGEPFALVLTTVRGEFEPVMLEVPVDLSCAEPGEGRLGFVHAANVDPVQVLVDGELVDEVAYGEGIAADLSQGDYDVEVIVPELDDVTATVPVPDLVLVDVIAVGNVLDYEEFSPLVAIPLLVDLDACEGPVTPTTAVTTTTATPASAAPAAATATPRFTG